MKTKICSRCNQEKSISEFYKRPSAPDGYRDQCKSCLRDQVFARNSAHALIKCACGCGTMIPKIDRWGKPREYVNGHARLGTKHTEESKAKMSSWQIGKVVSEESRRKQSQTLRERGVNRGSKNHFWKGGRAKLSHGYIGIFRPDHHGAHKRGYVLEHRLKMEEYLGRELLPSEVVHHVDGNRANNNIENLQVMTRSEHTTLHWIERKKSKMAIDCFDKKTFEDALPVNIDTDKPLWQELGLIDGEYTYMIPVHGTNKRIVVRSSIQSNGHSAKTGADSLRLWVEYHYAKVDKWIALVKLDTYTTREPGWQSRMTKKLRKLYRLALEDSKGRKAPSAGDRCGEQTQQDETRSPAEGGAERGETHGGECCSSAASHREAEGAGRSAPARVPAPTFLSDREVVVIAQENSGGDILCPKCNEPMVLRRNRRNSSRFWGCSNYPKCRGTRPYRKPADPKVAAKAHEWSDYQKAIFDFVQNGEGHGVIGGVAGCGKTTTNIGMLEYTDRNSRVALVAFNRHIAKEQARRAPDHVTASTLHSLGYANIKAVWPKVEVEPKKLWYLLNDMIDEAHGDFQVALETNKSAIVKLVSLCKATLRLPMEDNLNWIADRWGMNTNGQEEEVFKATGLLYYASVAQKDIIDYDDMIHFCATGVVPCEQFDFLIVDETQDLNRAQVAMALLSVTERGRIIASGDENQSVYGFRGADVDAVPSIIKALNATVLPLSISYRCPLAVVRLVNEQFPHIPFEAASNAPEGLVARIGEWQILDMLQDGDMVLCRCNAPLVFPAFELIRRGIKATILGRDIGKGLHVLISKVSKRSNVHSLLDLLSALSEYRYKEITKLLVAKKTARAATLDDQVETIVALVDGVTTIRELECRINSVFTDEGKGVVFSSVHRAKGGEANRVFIIRPDLMPHKLATQDWERQQENNIRYVAYTRAKKELYFVEG